MNELISRSGAASRSLSLRVGVRLCALVHRARVAVPGQTGQATVEYVGLVMVLGTGIAMIVAGLDGLGFATKIGLKIIKGVTSALDKITPG